MLYQSSIKDALYHTLHSHPPALSPSPPRNASNSSSPNNAWRNLDGAQPPWLKVNTLDIVSIWIQYVGCIVAFDVLRSFTRRTIVFTACFARGESVSPDVKRRAESRRVWKEQGLGERRRTGQLHRNYEQLFEKKP